MQHIDWPALTAFAVALTGAIAAIGVAAAKIIAAIHGEAAEIRDRVDQHEENAQERARELKDTLEK